MVGFIALLDFLDQVVDKGLVVLVRMSNRLSRQLFLKLLRQRLNDVRGRKLTDLRRRGVTERWWCFSLFSMPHLVAICIRPSRSFLGHKNYVDLAVDSCLELLHAPALSKEGTSLLPETDAGKLMLLILTMRC